ncbi:MAG: cell division protein ZapB [Deltaproteobacteria bacterium HGW-Deltaproteobacteria-4]|nr:MAG: cell division protein ZapB [Deltaproteobacteria bacterium HGW-Deltaproteobacteria-4]
MFAVAIQRLEFRIEELVDAYKKLKIENRSLVGERDDLLRERQFMREELDRILSRFAKIDEESP